MNQPITQLEQRLTEAFDDLWNDFVDPGEAYAGEEGDWWAPVATIVGGAGRSSVEAPFSEVELNSLRGECRRLALVNEFAINGHENRISYIVGPGHSYRVTARKGIEAPDELAMKAQGVLEQFLHNNRWRQRQQEIIRRMDRDGEAFLRFFVGSQGTTEIRFVEPDQIATPTHATTDPSASFGIVTQPGDVEAVTGYYLDEQLIDASQIQHRKANVDSNVKRGLPLYTSVRKNLRRAEKLLRNMSVVAEVQSAIALIRKHRSATRSGVEQFVADQSSFSGLNAKGQSRRVSQYGPGTILDAPAGLEYDFPASGVDAGSFVAILQAELRAIAARLVMPEFMFTSDASNANFASTMIAESPAVRMFERQQAAMIGDDCDVMWRVLDNAARAGRLPTKVRDYVEVQVTPPPLQVRDRLQEAQVNRIAHQHGVLSPQTWSQRLGLDYDQEQKNLKMHGGE